MLFTAGDRGDMAQRSHEETLISVADHLASVLAQVEPLEPLELPLRAAAGLTLADDVQARVDLPVWDNSAMDGYALRAADTDAASNADPVALRVVGEVAAGSALDPALESGAAVRIMTGAPVPSAADAVVPIEDVRAPGETRGEAGWDARSVVVTTPVRPGAHVRRRGEDVTAGQLIACAQETLGARRLAAIAAAGVAAVRVRPRPRVAVIATGAELRAAGKPLARGEIPESNSLLVAALLAEDGIAASSVEVSDDDAAAFAARLASVAALSDVVVTTGGVGPGRHDIVRIALEREPGVRAVRVAVKPGQPQCVGRLASGALVFALPGNPVSAAVSYELFVRPALRRLQGMAELQRPRTRAVATLGWRHRPGRLQVLPVRVTRADSELRCEPAVDPSGYSHAAGRHGAADGYALVAAERGDVIAGEDVDVLLVGG